MRSKRGFTLIELLAVIVILAIVALIATPIVLNIINGAKESSNERSAENYITAVEQAVAKEQLNNTNEDYDGTYEIVDNGKNIQKGNTKIKVSYEGKGLESGRVIINKGSVEKLYKGKIGNSYVQLYNNKITSYQIKGESTLIKGSEFINKIISLSSDMAYDRANNLKYIGFYSNGNLPEGYTKEELLKLENVSVSSDNKIKAYYDSEKETIYVYSENQIYANEDSSDMFNRYGVTNSYFDNLKEINLLELDTSRVTNMSEMFNGCFGLTTLDLSSFNTSNVTYMSYMFSQSGSHLTTLDLSSFDTSNVTDMYGMFNYFDGKNLNLSSFDTSKVTHMTSMFSGTSNLKEIIVSNKWVINSATNTEMMFDGCGTDHVTVK